MRVLTGPLQRVSRRLLHSPMFTVVTLLTIALGIGANTAIFSVVNGILLKPLPYHEASRLVSVWQSAPAINLPELNVAPSDYFTFREDNHTFEEIGMWDGGTSTITGVAAPEEVRGINITNGILEAFKVQPLMGRAFTTAELAKGGPNVVILSYGFWQRRFGGDRAALGRQIRIDGKSTEIVGVMPKSFQFLEEKPDIIQPFQLKRSEVTLGNFSYRMIARLKPGMTLAQANADVGRMIPIVNTKFPPPPGFSAKMFEDAQIQPNVKPLRQDVIGDLSKTLWILMGSIAAVLLIACANVANLLLVRADGRQQELAIRAALGAGSGRIASELLLESFSLAILGGAVGLGLAWALLRLLTSIAPAFLPRLDEIGIDPGVLLFTLAVTLLAGLFFGSIPVLKYRGGNLIGALRSGTRTVSQSREANRTRNALVVLQTALAVVLLIGSGLMLRTFRALRNVQPGFASMATLQTVRLHISEEHARDTEKTLREFQEIQRKLSEIPGVSSVAFANSVPADFNNSTDVLYAEDKQYRDGQLPPLRRFKFVAPGYFQTLGIPLIAGRDLTWTDLYDQHRLYTIISENMAREMWQDPRAAIGKRIREGMKDPWREIVGVVGDVRSDGADLKAPTTVYWPLRMKGFWGQDDFLQRGIVYALRSGRAGSQSFLEQVRQAVWSVNKELPLARIRTMEDVYRGTMARRSFTLVMLAIAGGMALLLGLVGIYGVISYSVSQRTHELGIRIALGAGPGELRGMVVRHGLVLGAVGVGMGLGGAAVATRVITSLLFQVSSFDPLTYLGVAAGLLAAAAAASYIPAHRASNVNPIEALRVN
jgi:putative ABC transport system permease protein